MHNTATILSRISLLFLFQSFIHLPVGSKIEKEEVSINGMAPSLFAENNKVYMAFVSGDSILYCYSNDKGKNFSAPLFVAVLSKLGVGGGRGPQIISVKGELMIAAVDGNGNIYPFTKNRQASTWERMGRINDVPEMAKEGFVSLATNNRGEVYAVWLDLRSDKRNKIVGAMSRNAGKTWSRNKIIYKSPDSTVCECCKPSVEMKDQLVVVMFRNFINGYRDLHIIQSVNGGLNFGEARKLGEGNWKLNGCPMDGGGLVINSDNSVQTIWRRQGNIFRCEAGKKEEWIAGGKQCVMAGNQASNYIAFMNDGKVYCIKPDKTLVELGRGGYPQLESTGATSAICAWENEGKINYALLNK